MKRIIRALMIVLMMVLGTISIKATIYTDIDELSEDEINSGGYVVSTLEAALWCVLTSKDYCECLLKAVNLGGDTDTTACVAGALGSLRFSFNELPDSWVNEIKNKDLIQDCLF